MRAPRLAPIHRWRVPSPDVRYYYPTTVAFHPSFASLWVMNMFRWMRVRVGGVG